MYEKPTNELEELVKDIKPDGLSDFFNQNKQFMADDAKAFYYYYKSVIDTKGIYLKDVYSFAGVSESYGGQIIREEKHTRNRDMILRLCIAGHFNPTETNRALKLYGMKELYVKNQRDVCISVAIQNRQFDLAKIDELLEENNFTKLSVDE